MIYDIHTHFWKNDEIDSDLINAACKAGGVTPRFKISSKIHLDETGITDRSVVFGFRGNGFKISNDTVKDQVDLASDRLVFFTSIDPSEENFMEELERTHQDLGARGIKLGPIYQGVHPTDKRYHRIYKYAQKNCLPILIHMAATFTYDTPLDYTRPLYMDTVAVEYPELKIILPHLGHPWIGETVTIIRRQPNVYADISALYYRPWQFYNAMQLLIEYGTSEKVFFGSDFPFTSPAESIKGVKNVNKIVENTSLPHISQEIIEGILHRDSFSILGIC